MPAVLLGSQEPTFKWVTPYVHSWGPEAINIWQKASGKVMDAWQANFLTDTLGVDDEGLYAADRGVLIVGRQNGKGDIIEARELAGLTFLEEKLILHSAHEFKTAREAFLRMLELVENSPDLDRRVLQVTKSKGEEGIKFKGKRSERVTGNYRLVYVARSGGSGRGFTGVLNVMDEAMILDADSLSALMPTMSAMRNPQILYFGSAGARKLRSGSEVLARVRRSALRKELGITAHLWEGQGKQSTTWAIERTDPNTWARLNPSFGRAGGTGISKRSCRRELADMTPDDFDRERLGVGDWPSEEGWALMPQDHWTSGLYDATSKPDFPLALGIDMPPGLEHVSIVCMSMRADGLFHTERLPGTLYLGYDWAIPFLVDLCSRREIGIIVVDPKSPASVIIEDLKKTRPKTFAREIYEASPMEVCTWSAQWLTAATKLCSIRHIGQRTMERAVGGAVQLDVGDGNWKWSRKRSDVDISALYASTFAWGGLKIGWKKRRPMLASVQ